MFSQFNKKTSRERVRNKDAKGSRIAGARENIESGSRTVLRQKTLSAFFAKKPPKESDSTPLAADRRSALVPRGKPLFHSQGSFEEEEADADIQRLINEKPLNNFKSLSRTSSGLGAGPTEATSATETWESVSSKFTTSTQDSLGSSTLIFEEDAEFVSSTQRTAPKRPAATQFGFSLGKRVKPIRPVSTNSFNSSSSSQGKFELTAEQRAVINLIVWKRKNVFYTGSAGTGKSVVLREVVKQLRARYGESAVAITASTGLAAVNIGGVTINRFSGIGIGKGTVQKLAAQLKRNKTNSERWKRTAVLIIDEVSMIDGNFLDKMDLVARDIRKVPDKPFGGVQVVLTGDFFQLPPVADRDPSVPKPPFCFESRVWREAIDNTICLTQVFRQKDEELINLLNSIRFGDVTTELAKMIKSFERDVEYTDGILPTELYPTRREVDLSNKRMLDRLPGEIKVFEAQDQATSDNPQLLKVLESLMAEKKLALKEEAQVMMIKNFDETLVNGSVGKVLYFTTEALQQKMLELYPSTKLSDPDLVLDMRLIYRCIGLHHSTYSRETQLDINSRPVHRQDNLMVLLSIAEKEDKQLAFPMVRFTTPSNGYRYEHVIPVDFTIDIPAQKSSVSRVQLPLILCWALSIHKAQGQTIDRLKVDLRKVFEEGQVYVALSRAVSKDRLQIVNFQPRVIKANQKVKEFYKTLERIGS